jgi:hypothetical protein
MTDYVETRYGLPSRYADFMITRLVRYYSEPARRDLSINNRDTWYHPERP